MLSNRYRNDGQSVLRLDQHQLSSRDAVQRKVDDGTYSLETVPCCLCDGSDFVRLAEKDRYGLSYSVVICKKCGLTQTNPRMNREAYGAFYDREYRPIYVGSHMNLERFYQAEVVKGRRILATFNTLGGETPHDAFVLEVGCGAGGILHPFREAGFRTMGCDLGSEYLEFGCDVHGLDLVFGSLADIDLPQRPDFVIYSHVLEHISDPVTELRLVRDVVSEAGMVYVEVPGLKWIRSSHDADFLRYLQNAHTYHFTLLTLTNLMHRSGFDVVVGDERVRLWAQPGSASPYRGPSDFDSSLVFLRRLERLRPLYRVHPRTLIRYAKMALLKMLDRLELRDPLRDFVRRLKTGR